MTGYGGASGHNDRFNASIELKAVNNRYLKINVRCPDALSAMESEFERLVRESISRGTVSVNVRLTSVGQSGRFQIVPEVITGYWQQLREWADQSCVAIPEWSDSLLLLPGVVADELGSSFDAQSEWSLLERVTKEAIDCLSEFRQREGKAMRDELERNCDIIAESLERVVVRAPGVVATFRDKLLERVRELVTSAGGKVDQDDLIRDVSIFAERCDINEEIARLKCHIDQFRAVMNDKVSQGRKLDFLSQEMFREVNTMGSKASDVEIAHLVVEMKSAVEKMREVLQNVE